MLRSLAEAVSRPFGKLLTFAAAEFVARALTFALLLLLPTLVTRSTYGEIGLLISLEVVASSALILGLDRAVLRYGNEDSPRSAFLFTTYIGLSAITTLLVLGGILILLLWPADIFFGLQIYPTLIVMLACMPFLAVLGLHFGDLRARNEPSQYAKTRIGYAAAKTLVVGGAVWYWRSSAAYSYGLLAVAALTASTILVPAIRRLYLHFEVDKLLRALRYGWPFAFHVMAGGALMYVDRFMIASILGPGAAGVYVLSYSCGASLLFLYSMFSVYYEPFVYRMGTAADRERSLRFFAAGSLVCGGGVAFVVERAVRWGIVHVWGAGFLEATTIVPIILSGFLLYPFYLCGNWRLGWVERTRVLAIASGVAVVINVGANVVLLRKWGLFGAAVASVASYWFLAIVVYVSSSMLSRRGEGSTWRGGQWLAGTAVLAAAVAVAPGLASDCALAIIVGGSALHVWRKRSDYREVFGSPAAVGDHFGRG